jgi:hypothetical protein
MIEVDYRDAAGNSVEHRGDIREAAETFCRPQPVH